MVLPVHEAVAVQVVDSQGYLVENIEGQLLRHHLPPLQQVQSVLSFEILSHDVVMIAIIEHLEHFNDVWVVLSRNRGTICLRISN
jgi:hypothetical protein